MQGTTLINIALACLVAGLSLGVDARRGGSGSLEAPVLIQDNTVPYAVQLRNSAGNIVCAGGLISAQYVVTAAHCFDKYQPSDIKVVAGAFSSEDTGVQGVIEKVFKHDSYDSATLNNDVAVIKLESPLEASQKVVAITKYGLTDPPSGDKFQLNGWEKEGEQNGLYVSRQSALISKDDCIAELKTNGIEAEITNSMLCGNADLRFPCTYTAGGPVYRRGEIVGILIGGKQCDNPKFPGLFTNLHAVRDFIEKSVTQ